MNFEGILGSARAKSEWVEWLLNDADLAAASLREFLDVCFQNIPANKRPAVENDIARGDELQVHAVIHELVAYELLVRLKLSPEFKPNIAALTPDLSFSISDQVFIADVFLTHSPAKTLREFCGAIEARDTSRPGESRAHKIEHVITQKCAKYASTDLPFVLFVFMGDHNVRVRDLEKALYGMTVTETTLEQDFPNGISRERIRIGGCLLPDETGQIGYRNLAAAISCDWFDTLNSQDRGKRLHCYVIHNYSNHQLPIEAFDGFAQVTWDESESGRWKARYTGTGNIVAKFNSSGSLELRSYTASNPW